MEMDSDTIQELIAGYAIGALDEAEIVEVEKLLQTNEQARKLLAEFEAVTTGLALSIAPVELPSGSLERLRQKAGIEVAPGQTPQEARPRLVSMGGNQIAPGPKIKLSNSTRQTFWQSKAFSFGAYAAALVLLVTTAVFGLLWLNTHNRLSDEEQTRQQFARLLTSPDLKVTELKSTDNSTGGSIRMFADPSTNKVYLVAQNMTTLPGDKEYEAWLITTDSQPHPVGLLGTGGKSDTNIFELKAPRPLGEYKQVALTIEKKGGSPLPTSPPVMAGTIPV
ncbi:MAG: hypothetical protein JWP00_502 [Chloroflexi bacterium]|nr:hypothetical protein [Chloroflexota bacterium]